MDNGEEDTQPAERDISTIPSSKCGAEGRNQRASAEQNLQNLRNVEHPKNQRASDPLNQIHEKCNEIR